MLKAILIGLVSATIVSVFLMMSVHADQAAPVAPSAPAVAEATAPQVIAPELAPAPAVDPWFAPMRALVEQASDAYMDKPHTFRGLPGEPEVGRALRLDRVTRDIVDAAHARAGELAQFGQDAAWKYALTLVCVGHRETRFASNPSKLGNQDNGRAAGYWQIWERRDHADRYSAATALDMLINEPRSSWSLPKGHPWTGYPTCSKWLAENPSP